MDWIIIDGINLDGAKQLGAECDAARLKAMMEDAGWGLTAATTR